MFPTGYLRQRDRELVGIISYIADLLHAHMTMAPVYEDTVDILAKNMGLMFFCVFQTLG